MFSAEELERYARHFRLPGFGVAAQLRLRAGKVLVVGAGGLGCPALQYLAAAGVGCIGIADGDTVDLSNLQRQVLYGVDDIGKSKADCARERLLQLNPNVRVEVHNKNITRENAAEIIEQYDVILDCTDNFPSRYLLNDTAVAFGKPNIFASVSRFEGQVTVFNLLNKDGSRGPQYRDIFPEPPAAGTVPDCAEGGVLGVLPGILGAIQALEAIKILGGVGESLSGKMLILDALSMQQKVFSFVRST
jgi:sulfur-carrier protein adenylyltransferase/sulfurtransferase